MKPFLAVLLAFAAAPLFADADLVVETLQPAVFRAGDDFHLSFPIRNDGPDSPSAAIATLEFSPELRVVDTNLRGCGGADPLRCQTGDLVARIHTSVEVTFRAPRRDATYAVTLTLSATIPDPNPANNRATATVKVSTDPDLFVAFPFGSLPVDPGATFDFPFYVYNTTPLAPARNVALRIEVENATIEHVTATNWDCDHSETSAQCVTPQVQPTLVTLTLRASGERDGRRVLVNARVSGEGGDVDPASNEASGLIPITRWIAVTTTADAGAGTLRAAIDDANRSCRAVPCRIAFELPPPVPGEGWFTIQPISALPLLDAERVIVDGTTQTAFTGDTNPDGPEVFLDGRHLAAGDGLELRAVCSVEVRGLAVGNFNGYGLRVGRRNTNGCPSQGPFLITSNYLGTDPTGRRAAPNLRGLLLDRGVIVVTVRGNVISGNHRAGVWDAGYYDTIATNRIGVAADGTTPLPNGASGVFAAPGSRDLHVLRNTISFNAEMGVAVSANASAAIFANSMRANGGLGIDNGLDGVTPRDAGFLNPPTLFAAHYDAATNTTTITGRIDDKRPQGFTDFTIGLYANDAPDGDGEEFIASVETAIGESTFTATAKGDLRGRWINAAVTRANWIVFSNAMDPRAEWFEPSDKVTSELSAAVFVE